MAQISYGTITITDTNDIERIYVVYAKSTANTTAPSAAAGTWTESISTAPGSGNYIWQRTVTERSGTHDLSYGDPVCVTGPQGGTGATGATGRGVSSIVTTYCNYGTGTPAASYDGWQSTVPTYDNTKPNYWVKTVITYTSGDPATDTSIYKDNGLTEAIAQSVEANYNAAMANSISQSANENANGAMSQASAANIIAEGLQSKLKYMWRNLNADTPTYPTGTYAASGINGIDLVESDSSTYGFNSLLRHTQLAFRYNAINLTTIGLDGVKVYAPVISNNEITSSKLGVELTSSALNLYGSSTSTADVSLTSTGLKLVKGGIEARTTPGQSGYVYLSTEDKSGITINGHIPSSNDPKWRAIIGTKFGVDSEGNLYASNANINGSITATSLTITNDAEVSGVVVPDDISDMATTTDVSNALYSVEIKVTAIDYVANTATLTAIPFYQGSTNIPNDVTLVYTWYKDSVISSNIVGSNSNTLTITNTTAMGLNRIYFCVISTN